MNESGTLDNLGFTDAQAHKLQALRERYQHGELNEELSPKHLRRLKFIRWLVAQGRLSS